MKLDVDKMIQSGWEFTAGYWYNETLSKSRSCVVQCDDNGIEMIIDGHKVIFFNNTDVFIEMSQKILA